MSIFDELAAHGDLDFPQARMLPLAAYHSPDVLAAERSAVFADAWVCVGRTADLARPGDFLTAELPAGANGDAAAGDRSIIVVRDDRGDLSAHDNVCIHRGARLLEGCGNTARITCPYHAWSYRLDGGLIGAPYMQGTVGADGEPFRPLGHRLVPIRIEVWEGFIFATHDATAPALGLRLAGLTEVVGAFGMADYVPVHQQVDVWATNWKLLVENFMDAYHVFKVHAATFGKDGDSTLDTVMHPGTDDWAHHVVLPGTGDELAHPDNPRLTGEWRRAVVLAAVFPTHVMQLQPDWLWYLQISPLGTDRVRIRWDVSVAPDVLAAQRDPDAYVASVLELLHAVNAEDRPVVEGIRRNADGPQFPRGPLSYLERNVYDFDRYIARRLTAR
jgi:phenylpropionate dioxygenase-like ring-hydroxylating dioxygenase large terminal subunit